MVAVTAVVARGGGGGGGVAGRNQSNQSIAARSDKRIRSQVSTAEK